MLIGAIAVLILLVLILIGVLLTTKSGIVAGLFATKTPTATQMEANLAGDRPGEWTTERVKQTIEKMNQRP